MRLADKHLTVTMDKEIFHVNFDHFMQLEGHYNTIETTEEFGITPPEVMIIKKKMSRT